MTLLLNNSDALYTALINKDRSYVGHVFVRVTTTNIFVDYRVVRENQNEKMLFFVIVLPYVWNKVSSMFKMPSFRNRISY